MSNTQQFMNMLCDALSYDMLLEQLEEAIAEYKANPSEETKKSLSFCAMMLVRKSSIDSMGIETVMEETDKATKAFKMFHPNKS